MVNWKPANWLVLRIGSLFSIWKDRWRLVGWEVLPQNSSQSILRNELLAHMILMAHFTGKRSDGLCYKLIDWFYVSERSVLKGVREMNNLGYDFNRKFISETGKRFSFKFYAVLFQKIKIKILNIRLDEEPCKYEDTIRFVFCCYYYYFVVFIIIVIFYLFSFFSFLIEQYYKNLSISTVVCYSGMYYIWENGQALHLVLSEF